MQEAWRTPGAEVLTLYLLVTEPFVVQTLTAPPGIKQMKVLFRVKLGASQGTRWPVCLSLSYLRVVAPGRPAVSWV